MASLTVNYPNKYLDEVAVKMGKASTDARTNSAYIEAELTKNIRDIVRTVKMEQARDNALAAIETTLKTDFGV